MNGSIDYLSAKKWILDNFPISSDPRKEAQKYTDDMFLRILGIISAKIPFSKSAQNNSLALFLYSGCLKFERWFAPSPYIVPIDLHANFNRFLNALIKSEGGETDNSKTFKVHSLRNELYDLVAEKSIESIQYEWITSIRLKLNKIKEPENIIKRNEFIKEKNDLLDILSSIEDKSLRTVFRTWLPYTLDTSILKINLYWNGIQVLVHIKPNFIQSEESFVKSNQIIKPAGISRWQYGTSEVTLEFKALIDGDFFSPSLQALESHDMPVEGWPKCFNIAFNIINEVSWNLRVKHGDRFQWIPAPRDLGDMELMLIISGNSIANPKKIGSPANLMNVFAPSQEEKEIDLGEVQPIPWSLKCRSLTTMYLDLGETNEALFWLNVAVEALFKERFIEISKQANKPELEGELNSPKAFWAEAEEIVSKQYPELGGKIEWPDVNIHVSIYAKLKYIYKHVPMKTGVKELLSHYKKVSEHRNALFHGATESRIPVDVVLAAVESFSWILDNMFMVGYPITNDKL